METLNDHHFTKDHIAYLVEELRLSSLDNETSERARVALFEPINLEVYRKALGPNHVPCKYCAAVTVPPLATCHRCWEVVQRINKQVLHRWAATESGREFLCELEQLVTSAQNVAASHVEETEVVDSLKKPRKKRDTPYLDLGNAVHKRFEQVLRGNYEYDIAEHNLQHFHLPTPQTFRDLCNLGRDLKQAAHTIEDNRGWTSSYSSGFSFQLLDWKTPSEVTKAKAFLLSMSMRVELEAHDCDTITIRLPPGSTWQRSIQGSAETMAFLLYDGQGRRMTYISVHGSTEFRLNCGFYMHFNAASLQYEVKRHLPIVHRSRDENTGLVQEKVLLSRNVWRGKNTAWEFVQRLLPKSHRTRENNPWKKCHDTAYWGYYRYIDENSPSLGFDEEMELIDNG